MIVLGFLLIVATSRERHYKKCEGGYNKTDFFINLIEGFYSMTIGLLAILNIISERRFLILMTLLCVLTIFKNSKNSKVS